MDEQTQKVVFDMREFRKLANEMKYFLKKLPARATIVATQDDVRLFKWEAGEQDGGSITCNTFFEDYEVIFGEKQH